MQIDYSKQSINSEDIGVVARALKKKLITTGNLVPKFEKQISNFVSSKYAVTTNSATSALHIACLALGLKKNDYLWTSCNTFVASANCGLYCGSKVDLIDIDKDDYNLSIENLKIKLKKAKKQKKLPKIIIPVHFSGHSCSMQEIHKLSKYYKFKIIEDASHALGGYYNKKKVGNCKYSHITVFSFHPTKIITTIEGGVACTNSLMLYEKLSQFRAHGIERKKKSERNTFINYQQIALGYNYRMNDIQAALGINQLKRINLFLKKRRKISELYSENLNHSLIQLPLEKKKVKSTFHLYVIRIKKKNKKINRDSLYNFLIKKKIGVNIHYIPIHYHEFFKSMFKKEKFKESEKYYSEAISLPIHPELKKADVLKIIKLIKNFLN